VAIEPVVLSLSYSVYLQGWAFVLLFGFMLAFLKAMEVEQPLHSRMKMLFFCIAIIIALFFTYYSAVVYALGFAGIILLLTLYSGKMREHFNNKLLLTITIFIVASIALFIAYDPRIRGFLNGLDTKLTVAIELAGNYLSRLLGWGSQSSAIVSGGVISECSKMLIGLILYLILLAPIVALILVSIRRGEWKRKLSSIPNQAFLAILFVIALDVLVYMMVGTVSLKLVLLLAPFASAYAVTKFKINFKTHFKFQFMPTKALSVFIVLLLVLVPLKAGTYIGTAGDNSIEQSMQSSEWLMSREISNTTTLSEMAAAEKLFTYQTSIGITNGESTVFDTYTLYFFYTYNTSLANRTLTENSIEYLVITWDAINDGLAGTDWLAGRAIGDIETAFGKYTFLDLIYMDDYCIIYRFQSSFGVN